MNKSHAGLLHWKLKIRDTCNIHGLEESILRFLYFPNWYIYFFSIQSQSYPHQNTVEADNLILKSIWKCRKSRKSKVILKKEKVEGLTLPDFKT